MVESVNVLVPDDECNTEKDSCKRCKWKSMPRIVRWLWFPNSSDSLFAGSSHRITVYAPSGNDSNHKRGDCIDVGVMVILLMRGGAFVVGLVVSDISGSVDANTNAGVCRDVIENLKDILLIAALFIGRFVWIYLPVYVRLWISYDMMENASLKYVQQFCLFRSCHRIITIQRIHDRFHHLNFNI